MYTLLALTVLAQAPDPAASSAQPAQVLARIDARGNLTMTSVSPIEPVAVGCYGFPPPLSVPGKAAVAVKVTRAVVITAELPAKSVTAYSVDGKAISAETLATLLAKDRTVLVALDGKKVDPFFLQLYKEGTIILVPPANTLPFGRGGAGHDAPQVEEIPPPADRLPPPPMPRGREE